MGAAAGYGYYTTTGVILVLYILLVAQAGFDRSPAKKRPFGLRSPNGRLFFVPAGCRRPPLTRDGTARAGR